MSDKKRKPDDEDVSNEDAFKLPEGDDRDYGPYGQQRPDRRSADVFEPEEDDEAPSRRTPPGPADRR